MTQYIEENLGRQLPLAELSAVVHMSPYHLARVFKKSAGVSPHRFVLERRIERARAWLLAGDTPIAEISRSVGFSTPSHFSTTFHRLTGVTPRAYRREARQRTVIPSA